MKPRRGPDAALALIVVALLAVDVVALVSGAAEGGRGSTVVPATVPTTPPSPSPPPVPRPARTMVAAALGNRVGVFDDPSHGRPTGWLANPNENGAPLVFLVQEYRGEWLRVVLPHGPRGRTGWIRSAEVNLRQHNYRVVVQLRAHRITVFDGDVVLLSEPVGVGRCASAIRAGRHFYVKELLRPPGPNGPYGAFVYGLSGFNNQLLSVGRNDGVVGIHGTNDPSSIGKDVGYGCIRMSNAGITRLTERLPLGTPVEVLP